MSGVDLLHLEGLYEDSDDPWDFRTSLYEKKKFADTLAALKETRYRAILEVGCGNGELGRLLAARTTDYIGFDAIETAIRSASRAVPNGEFHLGFFPCFLPEGGFDLIVVSEFLYFLSEGAIGKLAEQIMRRWPDAEIVSVNYLGASGNPLEGTAAADLFTALLASGHYDHTVMIQAPKYRIDRFLSSRQGTEAQVGQ
ncbi:trans-aconitate 2-methyltransferase [Notoacmeibacter sp. MSK16QG-6]|uniref:class I SAM-dependent methyltransferase n=1 Tax=Notoacmeibacter sp. MSK16QG-6 TaxID=2957982 RepID=UPI00209D0904|nr:class I SAM-dependent methyltransferase [Notoacmeibacter sp. MSK16QG-6]MCP1200858.1 class I SAM-dependent methyltransferase [Notoacmeibacter sp. MSK16QG-6]